MEGSINEKGIFMRPYGRTCWPGISSVLVAVRMYMHTPCSPLIDMDPDLLRHPLRTRGFVALRMEGIATSNSVTTTS